MKSVELFSTPHGTSDSLSALRVAIEKFGGYICLDSTLKKYPGCIHWHVKHRMHKAGTLELTYEPAEQRIWAEYRENRYRPWIDEMLVALRPDQEAL